MKFLIWLSAWEPPCPHPAFMALYLTCLIADCLIFCLQFLYLFLVCIIVPAPSPLPVRFAWLPLSSFSPRPSWSIYPSPPLTAPCRLSPPCISAWTCGAQVQAESCRRLPLPFPSPGQAAVMGPNALLISVTSQNIPADAHTGPIASTHKHSGPRLMLLRGTCEYLTLLPKEQKRTIRQSDTGQVSTSPYSLAFFFVGPSVAWKWKNLEIYIYTYIYFF